MSLFQRFFSIAVLVLLLQSLLIGVLVASRVRDQDERIALTELDESSRLVYENFNNWKRALWQQVIAVSPGESARDIVLRLAPRRTVDWVVQTGDDSREPTVFPVTGVEYPVQVPVHWNLLTRPRISVEYLEETLLLRASLPLVLDSGGSGALHLVKIIDETFCRQLAIDSPATATFLTPQGKLPGLPDLPSGMDLREMLRNRRGYLRFAGKRNELGERFNGSFRNTGVLLTENGTLPLYLSVLLDASWQDRRMHAIVRSLLFSSIVSIALSGALVLVGSWTLTKPIVRLTGAMEGVREGDLSIRLNGCRGREAQKLFAGFNGMTARLQADEEERQRHIDEITALTKTTETIFQSIAIGMITVDRALRILQINKAGERLLGSENESLRNRALLSTPSPELADHLAEMARNVFGTRGSQPPALRRTAQRVYTLSGTFLNTPESIEGPVLEGCLLVVEDVTEKLSLEERMVRAEKLSSLSLLTAGVAHEINNPLSSITANVQNLAWEIEDPDQKKAVDYIEQETRRIRDIVGKLLRFSGGSGSGSSVSDVNEEVNLVIDTLRCAIPERQNVFLQPTLNEPLSPAAIPATELRQILLNLVTNAFQALDGKPGGISLSTKEVSNGIRVVIEDNGIGMDEATQQRMFDPFFTTKPTGSGLGLSVVYGLITRYGGSCAISSAEGEGTRVEFELPRGSGNI
ncbi:MAG: sensor histidine kinase [Spirochaetaceae bacterium]